VSPSQVQGRRAYTTVESGPQRRDHAPCRVASPQSTAGFEYAPAEGMIETDEQPGTVAVALHNAARAQHRWRRPPWAQWDTGPLGREITAVLER
jgi:hypothetical protein